MYDKLIAFARSSRGRTILTAVLAVLATAGVTITVTDVNLDGRPDSVTVVVAKHTPSGDLDAGEAPATSKGVDPGTSSLRDETPKGVSIDELRQAQAKTETLSSDLPALDAPLPVGGAQNYECKQDFAGQVYSARAPGSKVVQFVLHYTVSPNTTGWGDVLAIRDYFRRSRVGSAHLIVDFEGHCLQQVPWSQKAWTEGSFNSMSESVEIIATGKETTAQWEASPLIRKKILASIVRDRLRARGLPLKFVDPNGCIPQRGYTDHNHLECGNSHTDVAPSFPFKVFQRQLVDGPGVVTATDRRTCAKVNSWRKAGRPYGGPWSTNTQRRSAALADRGVKCLGKGPIKT